MEPEVVLSILSSEPELAAIYGTWLIEVDPTMAHFVEIP
jgi:hypothetical protein